MSPKKDALYLYGIVYFEDSFYIIGGYWESKKKAASLIARLNTKNLWSWSLAGNLNAARSGHSAIVANSRIIVVGGRMSDILMLFAYRLKIENLGVVADRQRISVKVSGIFYFLFSTFSPYATLL